MRHPLSFYETRLPMFFSCASFQILVGHFCSARKEKMCAPWVSESFVFRNWPSEERSVALTVYRDVGDVWPPKHLARMCYYWKVWFILRFYC